ncbi:MULTISPECIES: AMP-binding protein [unclassified Paenibacillus]|uniref:AMP-binding protein n=1 Tax=unclassified Paenibacillus TaxID=185978 RepID=UPI001C117374|nr:MULTISPECIES: AMP-binding protein [unclassified Paenibacillus]MBU5440416.1 AMP-binding protein [Paenibacillus sp. MSJ-34]CAH0119663.1 2-succinylbenzoate--CoA ligase [Paenibacillus sp. CECT 9249]
MLSVDSQKFDKAAFEVRYREMRNREEYRNPVGQRYAICLHHAFDLIAAVLYMKERDGSVLLMHGSTPFESALELAEQSGCSYLIYRKWDNLYRLSASAADYAPSILQYSSGTSRAPSLIAREWKQVDTEVDGYNDLFAETPVMQPVILVSVTHSFGLITGVMASVARGDEPIIVEDKNPKFALHTIRSLRRPIVYAVPFLFHVMDALSKGEDRFYKMVVSGSPPSEVLLDRMKSRTEEVWQQYGCTEAGCISVSKRPCSATDVGIPLKHLRVTIDASGGGGEGKGEIVVANANGTNLVRTKDMGCYDLRTDRLHVFGRMDDLINVSGFKVIPAEVESVILQMPGVKECIVHKTGHNIWGEAVQALIVGDGYIDESSIRSWCIKRLPTYKVPNTIRIVGEIPRTAAGKISRKQLQEMEM